MIKHIKDLKFQINVNFAEFLSKIKENLEKIFVLKNANYYMVINDVKTVVGNGNATHLIQDMGIFHLGKKKNWLIEFLLNFLIRRFRMEKLFVINATILNVFAQITWKLVINVIIYMMPKDWEISRENSIGNRFVKFVKGIQVENLFGRCLKNIKLFTKQFRTSFFSKSGKKILDFEVA